ncbi:ATP-binding protein [Rhizobium sp. CCGE532]|uniref:ATP-binding protein n=1 Tax=Rhizobium sp. CCGE532 TaxID=2364272 RepID=UPI001FDEE027|nr:ATP-binding protein [Rhizobium sp. CCGE532]
MDSDSSRFVNPQESAAMPIGMKGLEMLKHPTLNLLQQLGLAGMADAFARLADNDESDNLSHAEWLALLLDQEATWRNNKRLALRLRNATLHHPAVPEDIIRRAPREYDRMLAVA